jgi:hypothetical protein
MPTRRSRRCRAGMASTGDMHERDLVFLRRVEGVDRLSGGAEQHLAALLFEIGLCLRGKPDIALLAGADDEQITPFLEDGPGLRFRDDVRRSILLLGQFFLALGDLAIQSDLHVVVVGRAVDGDTAEFGAIDMHGSPPFLPLARPGDRLIGRGAYGLSEEEGFFL